MIYDVYISDNNQPFDYQMSSQRQTVKFHMYVLPPWYKILHKFLEDIQISTKDLANSFTITPIYENNAQYKGFPSPGRHYRDYWTQYTL